MPDPSTRKIRGTALAGPRRSQRILRILVFLAAVAFLLLRPQFQDWFGDPQPANDDSVVRPDPAEGSSDGNPLAEAADAAPLGELTEIRSNVFESTAGLHYSRYRIDHVIEHAEDDLSKPVHGVFNGDRAAILAMIDEAFLKATQDGGGVETKKQGDRLVYLVDMGRVVGRVGGQKGQRQNEPACRQIQLVVEHGNEVITAYPTPD